jgi:hypothetical protein
MITLLITVGALFVAVIGWTLLDPWPSPATRKSKNQADEERAQRKLLRNRSSDFHGCAL